MIIYESSKTATTTHTSCSILGCCGPIFSKLKPLECQSHTFFSLVSCRNPLFILFNYQLLRHVQEWIVYILACASACPNHRDSCIFHQLFDFFLTNLDFCFICDITLVGKNHYFNILSNIFFNFLKPWRNVVKRLLVCDVKNNYNAICSLVICISYRTVSFLTSSVPNL